MVGETTHKKNMIRVVMMLFVMSVFFLTQFSGHAEAQKIKVELFWGNGCAECEEMKILLSDMQNKYKWLEIEKFEIFDNKKNSDLLDKKLANRGLEFAGVPQLFIKDKSFNGYGDRVKREIEEYLEALAFSIPEQTVTISNNTIKQDIKKTVIPKKQTVENKTENNTKVNNNEKKYISKDSNLEITIPNNEIKKTNTDTKNEKNQKDKIDIPFLGSVNPHNYSLPLLTLIIAGMDSLNPCAFFFFFFLLGLLVHAQSKSRMLLIGGIFVVSSGLMYFLFMAAWLNLFVLMDRLLLITMIAGVIAIIFGIVNVKDYFVIGSGATLSMSQESRMKLFAKMRSLVRDTSIIGAIVGAVVLAQAANLYEFLCTAGFPMIYTRILTMNGLASNEYYLYLAFYNIIYALPLAIIVIAFSATLGRYKLTNAQIKALKLISGLMMLELGIFLSITPKLLNNIFVAVAIIIISILVGLYGYKVEMGKCGDKKNIVNK